MNNSMGITPPPQGAGIGNLPQNEAYGQAMQQGAYQSPYKSQADAQAAANQVSREPTLLERILAWRKRAQAKDKVLEYIEAQLNMDLFKGDYEATRLFKAGMSAAIEVIGK
jgi:hypothetical protein